MEESVLNRMKSGLLFIGALFVIVACSPSRETIDPPKTMSGQIMMVGNEPFTRLALLVSPEKSYLIKCDDATKQLLYSNQGKIAELVYNEILKTNRGEELNVLSAKIKTN